MQQALVEPLQTSADTELYEDDRRLELSCLDADIGMGIPVSFNSTGRLLRGSCKCCFFLGYILGFSLPNLGCDVRFFHPDMVAFVSFGCPALSAWAWVNPRTWDIVSAVSNCFSSSGPPGSAHRGVQLAPATSGGLAAALRLWCPASLPGRGHRSVD